MGTLLQLERGMEALRVLLSDEAVIPEDLRPFDLSAALLLVGRIEEAVHSARAEK